MEQLYRGKNKIAVVGGGPAGIYCALNMLTKFKEANFSDFFIYIFDKAPVLRTILQTGNGRCNITNSEPDIKEFASSYPRGEKFLYSIFSRYFNSDALDFFDSIDIKTYTQDDGRVFPVSNSAKDVKDKMLHYLFSFKNAKLINKEINSKNDLKEFDKIVISAGSRNTENLIKSFSHTCAEFKKSLCALKIKDPIFPEGVSIKSLDGDLIFTKNGISGPLAFKISSLNAYKNFPYEIEINLFDSSKLISLREEFPKKSIGNVVSMLVPRSFAKAIVKDFDKNICEVSKDELKKYSKLKLTITSTADFGEIVNAGGVDLAEIDKNCKSKICDNLWFCGEILNIDGFCGGYNLQNCWSSAYVVANDIVRSII